MDEIIDLGYEDPRLQTEEPASKEDFLRAAKAMPPQPDYDYKNIPHPVKKAEEYDRVVEQRCNNFREEVEYEQSRMTNLMESLFGDIDLASILEGE